MPQYSSRFTVCTAEKSTLPALLASMSFLYMGTGVPPVARPSLQAGFSFTSLQIISATYAQLAS